MSLLSWLWSGTHASTGGSRAQAFGQGLASGVGQTLGILSAVSGGWVNNEPDTQRRRGVDESYRKSWTNLV